jgi:hypothetical protein
MMVGMVDTNQAAAASVVLAVVQVVMQWMHAKLVQAPEQGLVPVPVPVADASRRSLAPLSWPLA